MTLTEPFKSVVRRDHFLFSWPHLSSLRKRRHPVDLRISML